MTVFVKWLLDKHIVDYQMMGLVTSNDMIAAAPLVVQMMQANPTHAVHVLYDVRECKKIPHDIPNILRALKPFLLLNNMGWGISYGSRDPITKFTADIIVQLVKVRYRDFRTQGEALQFLGMMDTYLPELEAFHTLQQLNAVQGVQS